MFINAVHSMGSVKSGKLLESQNHSYDLQLCQTTWMTLIELKY
ncbi:hypothetical protein J2W17_000794 [Pseudomonas lini]|nr:hypothetical protein [Pseudomonas lini]